MMNMQILKLFTKHMKYTIFVWLLFSILFLNSLLLLLLFQKKYIFSLCERTRVDRLEMRPSKSRARRIRSRRNPETNLFSYILSFVVGRVPIKSIHTRVSFLNYIDYIYIVENKGNSDIEVRILSVNRT